jgi:hypothetical protein
MELVILGICIESLRIYTDPVIEISSVAGPNRVGVSPSPEDGNRSSFRNVVLF